MLVYIYYMCVCAYCIVILLSYKDFLASELHIVIERNILYKESCILAQF